MGRFLPPDHSKGDASTIGGYMAVHARPAAFEGADGMSYSVEIDTDETGDRAQPVGAYLLFVQWARGEPRVTGHLETDFLERGTDERAVRDALGAYPLEAVKRVLDALIRERARSSAPSRPWWEAMQNSDDDDE